MKIDQHRKFTAFLSLRREQEKLRVEKNRLAPHFLPHGFDNRVLLLSPDGNHPAQEKKEDAPSNGGTTKKTETIHGGAKDRLEG
jgi:hypothetical protein